MNCVLCTSVCTLIQFPPFNASSLPEQGVAGGDPEASFSRNHMNKLLHANQFYHHFLLFLKVPKTEVSNNGLSRSASITSNGDCSMSSGCMSEVDEENAFDVEYPDGGTIRRKPTAPGNLQPLPAIIGDTLPLPPPPQSPGDLTPTDNGHALPLPPPPLPLVEESHRDHVQEPMVQTAVREEIYPCGVMRTRYPTEVNSGPEVAPHPENGAPCSEVSQLSLLQQLPSQPPPNLHNLMMHDTNGVNGTNNTSSTPAPTKSGGRKITFSEYVHNLEESVFERLKGSTEEPEEKLKEQDVSNWVLDSLRHCSNGSTPPSSGSCNNGGGGGGSSNGKPKIYNGRSVPNCFSPEEIQQRLQAPPAKFPPPPPPMRSDGTYLTH